MIRKDRWMGVGMTWGMQGWLTEDAMMGLGRVEPLEGSEGDGELSGETER
jgi:hypothetical protein